MVIQILCGAAPRPEHMVAMATWLIHHGIVSLPPALQAPALQADTPWHHGTDMHPCKALVGNLYQQVSLITCACITNRMQSLQKYSSNMKRQKETCSACGWFGRGGDPPAFHVNQVPPANVFDGNV